MDREAIAAWVGVTIIGSVLLWFGWACIFGGR